MTISRLFGNVVEEVMFVSIGSVLMGISIVAMIMMPLVFMFMWVQIRTKIMDEKKEKDAEKSAISILMNVELIALALFVVGTYLKSMVTLLFVIPAIAVVIIAIFMFNRKLNEPEVEVIINNGGDTA